MKYQGTRTIALSALLALGALTACKDDNNDNIKPEPGDDERKYVTLTASFPDEAGTAGNGGTLAYALTLEQAVDPNFSLNIYQSGFPLRSARTARVQASENGTELYNIQYTGEDGGVFNKYLVKGGANFVDTGDELDLSDLVGTSPRWVKSAEGIGIGVHLTGSTTVYEGTAPNLTYKYTRGKVRIADIDLIDARVINSTEFDFPLPAELEAQGYSVGRVDVPVLNAAKSKLYIGCNLSKVDPTKLSFNENGDPVWASDNNRRTLGTLTLVVDYPSLQNPKLLFSEVSKVNNHSYRTMTQYVGDDGHVYQATATGGQDILRISKNTDEYDNSYHFSLDQALGLQGTRIMAWRYISEGKGVVLYNVAGTGGYIALIDLNSKTATKIANEFEATLDFGQFQNIGLAGDYVYIPLTPPGSSGRLYVLNWKTNEVIKGASLSGQSGSFFIGAY